VIGICDDEEKSREMIKEYCQQMGQDLEETFEYKMFASGEEVLEYKADIHILLLDIEMGGMNGIDAMKKLEDADNIKNILFVSGYPDMVFEAFGEKTRGFVCKPVEYNRLVSEVSKILNRQKNKEIIEVSVDGRDIYIELGDIIYISAEGNFVRLVTEKESYFVYENLKNWEERLKGKDIIRIHKSYLVNLAYVADIKDKVTLTKRSELLPVGRKYKDDVKGLYKEFLLKSFRGE